MGSDSWEFLQTKECTIAIVGFYACFILAKAAARRVRAAWTKCQNSKAGRLQVERKAQEEEIDTDTGLQKLD